jgi:hypothetical protein
MKAKDIRKFKDYCNSVMMGLSDPLPSLPVTYKKTHHDTYSKDVESFILDETELILDDLRLSEDDHIGAEEEDLILRRLRQRAKEKFRDLRRRLPDQVPAFQSHFKNEDLIDGLKFFLRRVNAYRVVHAQSMLACNGESLDLIKKVALAWTADSDPKVVAVIAHFIWQIKRKLSNKPVVHHLMPILFGEQAAGKSRAVKALLGPLDALGLALYAGISQISDDRYHRVLQDSYCLFADEMASADKADINALKNIISGEILNPRKLSTNSAYCVRQNCTFIGATNRPVNEIIFDPTGMRRFYQINVLERMDWESINKIDYLALFKEVNERRDEGYLDEVLSYIRAEQSQLVNHDDLHHFLEDKSYSDGRPHDSQFMSNTTLYDEYRTWAYANGDGFLHSKRDFLKKLRNRGFKAGVQKVAGRACRGLWINISQEIDDRLIVRGELEK